MTQVQYFGITTCLLCIWWEIAICNGKTRASIPLGMLAGNTIGSIVLALGG